MPRSLRTLHALQKHIQPLEQAAARLGTDVTNRTTPKCSCGFCRNLALALRHVELAQSCVLGAINADRERMAASDQNS